MKIDVSKCKYFNNGKCERYENHVEADYNDYTVVCICESENCLGSYDVCDYLELQQLEAIIEKIKEYCNETARVMGDTGNNPYSQGRTIEAKRVLEILGEANGN